LLHSPRFHPQEVSLAEFEELGNKGLAKNWARSILASGIKLGKWLDDRGIKYQEGTVVKKLDTPADEQGTPLGAALPVPQALQLSQPSLSQVCGPPSQPSVAPVHACVRTIKSYWLCIIR